MAVGDDWPDNEALPSLGLVAWLGPWAGVVGTVTGSGTRSLRASASVKACMWSGSRNVSSRSSLERDESSRSRFDGDMLGLGYRVV